MNSAIDATARRRRAHRARRRRPTSLQLASAAALAFATALALAALPSPAAAAAAPPPARATTATPAPPPAPPPATTATPAAGAAAAATPKSAPAPAPAPVLVDGPPVDKVDGLTLQAILAKSIAARGGLDKIHAIKTRRESGRISLEQGTEWPFVVEHKRPRGLRMEITLPGSQLIRAYDGLHGWQKQPQETNAQPLTPDDAHNLHNEADFDNALVDTTIKGHAELLGKETVDGATAYRVKVVLLTGDVFYYDIDSTSFLPIHWEGARSINHKLVVFQTAFSDYREVDGVKYPFLQVSSMKGSSQQQKIIFNKIESNPPLDDARFSQPATATTPAPPTAAPPPPAGAADPMAVHPAPSAPPPPVKPPASR